MIKKEIIIIGAGIAGLTAAIYAKRAGKDVLVIDKNGYGGKIITSLNVENYPAFSSISGFDLMEKIYNQAISFGTEISFEEVIEVNDHIIKTNDNTYYAETIIIASGSVERRLNIEGEEENIGKTVHFCGACDAHFYKGKEVAVVGSGNSAVLDGLTLSDLAYKVYMIVRRETFTKAEDILVKQLLAKENVKLINNANVIKIEKNNKLKLSIDNDSILEVDGLFLAIGADPDTSIYDVEKENGYIKVDNNMQTSTNYIFAAGDCVNRQIKQLTTASSYGTIAAMSAISYLNKRRNNE